MNRRIKIVCDRLEKVIELIKKTNYDGIPMQYLDEIVRSAKKLIDPSEKTLVKRLKQNERK